MEQLGIEMGVLVSFSGDLTTDTSQEFQDGLREKMNQAVQCAERVKAKWSTVVPG